MSRPLPPGITYRHLAKAGVARGWHKSWAYNVGARAATGDILVFHDGDSFVVATTDQSTTRYIVCLESSSGALA